MNHIVMKLNCLILLGYSVTSSEVFVGVTLGNWLRFSSFSVALDQESINLT